MSAEPHSHTFRRLLSRGPFARYMAGEAVSMVGTWMQFFAQSWLLTTLTHHAWVLGVINFAGGLPMLLLTMVGGSFADRFDKRRILYGVLATQISLAVLVGWLVAAGYIAIWHVLVVTMLLGIAAAFEVPAVSAFVPELVAKEDISRALAIDRSIFHATRLIGPALSGLLVASFGVPAAYYINAVSFFALIAAISTVAARPRGTDEEEEQRKGSMFEGFIFVRNDAPTRAMVLLMGAMTVFISPFLMIIMPLYSRVELHLDSAHMGALLGISGLGSFVGSLGLLTIPKGRRALVIKCAAAAISIGICGLTLAHSMAAAGVSLVIMTLGMSTTYGTANIVIQERAPDVIRGRVSAVAGLAFFGILPFSGLIVSALADLIGLRTAMGCAAAGFALTTALLLAGKRQLASAAPIVES